MSEKSILAIDDDPPILQLLRSLGGVCGAKVTATSEPEEFLSALLNQPPDLVFLDLVMPRFDGIEVLRTMAADKIASKIILISGAEKELLERTEALAKSWGLNVAGAIAKPLDPADLQKRIAEALGD